MKKVGNLVVLYIFPVLAICLLFLNGKIAEQKYEGKDISSLSQYNAVISSDTGKVSMHPGEMGKIKLTIKNIGTMAWIPQKEKSINVSYHILDSNGKIILQDGERTGLPEAVKSGQKVSLDMNIKAPESEENYKVEIDMVHENVTWFGQKGSKTLTIDLEVKK